MTARVTRGRAGELDVAFALEGDLATLVIPAAGSPRPGERLWEHTCFEVFVRADGMDAYHELNLAPSGAWQAHAFVGYRDGGPLADVAAPEIAVERSSARLEVRARVDLGTLSHRYVATPIRLALAAVLEHASGARSYWALEHPPGRPDFHHAEGFAVDLHAQR